MKVEFISSGILTGALIGGRSGFPITGAFFGVFAVSSSGLSTTIQSKDCIVSGPRSDCGDRPCRHFSLKGDLVAISDLAASRTTGPVKTGPWSPRTTEQTVVTYHHNNGDNIPVVGPLAINRIKSYYQSFPDFTQDGGWRRKNVYLQIKADGNFFDQIVHYETVKPDGTVVPFHESKRYEVDFVSHRWREYGSSYWQSFSSLRSASYPVDQSILPKSFRDYDRDLLHLQYRYQPLPEKNILGDLVRRCANDAQVVQTNSIELVRDIREFSSSLKDVYHLAKGKLTPKTMAKLYLSYKYGARLTVQDVKLIGNTVRDQLEKQRLAFSKVHASEVVNQPASYGFTGRRVLKYTYTIKYRPYDCGWRRVTQLVQDSGLFPSLQNSWDLIPLSFVVDWFAPIGDMVTQFDANTYWSTYDIIGCISSIKQTYLDVTSLYTRPGYTFVGSADLVYYTRAPHSQCLPASYFENSPREFRNYAEALALIVALKR